MFSTSLDYVLLSWKRLPRTLGGSAAQTARQVIQQRIREAERSAQLEYFQRQVGEIVSGVVQASNPVQGVTLGLDMKAEGNMPNNQKVPGERFKVHDRLRAVVLEVKDGPRGHRSSSRAHRNFLRRLLENEVRKFIMALWRSAPSPRKPGARAKVAVLATQPGVDAVGACVGIKGVRIQAIVKELHDEKIDIIQWDPIPSLHFESHQPSTRNGVYLSENQEGNKTATVVVSKTRRTWPSAAMDRTHRLAAPNWGRTAHHSEYLGLCHPVGDWSGNCPDDEGPDALLHHHRPPQRRSVYPVPAGDQVAHVNQSP